MDLIEFREEKKYIVVAVDYHTRRLWGKIIENKRGMDIVEFLRELCRQGKKPEGIITDNGKEFCNLEMKELCRQLNINHQIVSIESHKSNGRIERIIRTLRESILKSKCKNFKEKVSESIMNYNYSYHMGIKCTPIEALDDKTGVVRMENSPDGSYARLFKKGYREKFLKGQVVRVAKNENIKGCNKNSKGRFLDLGVIIEICLKDSYIVKLKNGRYVKKRHYDLKGMRNTEVVNR